MKKLTLALILVAAIVPAYSQRDRGGARSSGGGGHSSARSAPQRSAPQRSAPRATAQRSAPRQAARAAARPAQRTAVRSGRSSARTAGSFQRGSTGTSGRAANAGRSYRPGGSGFGRSHFAGRGWGQGPGYIRPSFSCYVGFGWSSRPSQCDVVWILDPTTGQYYQAYYYPQYGYYAWASSPLVAVGVYSPGISFSVRL